MTKKKLEIEVTLFENSDKQTMAREEIQDSILDICEKYKLCYYEIFGIIEAIKMDLQEGAEKES